MALIVKAASERLASLLAAPTGVQAALAAISEREGRPIGEIAPRRIRVEHAAAELAERTAGVQYPAFYVYCEKISNTLREKFRTFSGKMRLAVEVRVTHDHLEEAGNMLAAHVEAVTSTLDSHRGDWGNGMFYAGGYEVTFSGAKHGGKNFLQGAKVSLEIDASIG